MVHLSRRAALAFGSALVLAGAAAAPARAKLRLVIVTGGTGGVFYPYGGGLANTLTQRVPGLQATAQVTGGSVDNVKLLHAGEAEIGFATIDSVYDGIRGTGAYAAEGPQAVRLLARLYDSFVHVVAADSAGIAALPDMRGKRVSIGSAGSSTEAVAERLLAAAGLDPKADLGRDNLGVAESAGALKDGKIDAFFWIGGLPTAAVKDLSAGGQPKLRFVETGSAFAALNAAYPDLYRPMELPAATYTGQDAAVAGVGVANVLLVPESLPEDTVNAVLGGMFDNLDLLHQAHPEAAALSLASAYTALPVPFHPAAEAFYRGRGLAPR